MLIGCQINRNHDANKTVYYSAPELSGYVFRQGLPVVGAQLLLMTSCEDRYTFTDLSGSFTLGAPCQDLTETVPVTQLGYFYQLMIVDGADYYLWQVGGYGYGFKEAELKINLTDKTVAYLVTEGVDKPYYRTDQLVDMSAAAP